ncbi:MULTISPECIES: hypothetical protein [Parabacteroides]|uniref:hypothetical protein n=1 Tax=Parabacteroides leei TaxID=2939491 RepID=UPI0018971CE2|nr:hypothetical protein [Parabacteroides goldsteinii]
MKQNKLNLKYGCVALMTFILSSCSNETEVMEQPSSEQYTINVSVRSGVQHTRESELSQQEKIKRYDIFIYDTEGEDIVKYFSKTDATGLDSISHSFESTADFSSDKDVFVIVNNFAWKDNTAEQMEAITKAQLKAMEIRCEQNIEGLPDAMTKFNGYKKSDSENEPFVMSASCMGHNFSTTSKLNLELKRTYAKIVLIFKTTFDAPEDKDWATLKTIRVKKINNIPTEFRLFSEDESVEDKKFSPSLESYVYQAVAEYTLPLNVDLTSKGYEFDSFTSETLALRIFPQTPGSDAEKSTSLLIDFEVGSKDETAHRFESLIRIGKDWDGYQIKPNYAYIITISYGKVTNSITTDCQIVPWNLRYWEQEVAPNRLR